MQAERKCWGSDDAEIFAEQPALRQVVRLNGCYVLTEQNRWNVKPGGSRDIISTRPVSSALCHSVRPRTCVKKVKLVRQAKNV